MRNERKCEYVRQQSVLIADQNNRLVSCELSINDRPPYAIRLDYDLVRGQVFSGRDLFECLIALRRELEKAGVQILCNGARVDAWPSSMSRQMGRARKVYINVPGRSTLLTDLVGIFDHADLEKIGSVEQQRAYHRMWFDSLRTTR